MKNDAKETSSVLNGLIETLKDSEEGFRGSAERLASPALRSQFQSYISQRARFASELQREVERAGGVPEKSGSTTGAIHRGWVGLKSLVAGSDEHAILVEAEKGEDAVVKNYREALAKDMPRETYEIAVSQYKDVLATHNQIRDLRDSYAPKVRTGQPS